MLEYVDYITSIKWLYLFGMSLGISSIPYFYFSKGKYSSIIILFVAVLLTNVFYIFSDPFLYLWDEQFHAMVAKNMLKNPFYPYLLEPDKIYEHSICWVGNNVWLHKQPAFLWLIALSFKVFGVHYWSLRLPSAILSALQIFAIYGIGKRVLSKEVGFWAAIFYFASAAFVPLITGRLNTDHNDAMFATFVIFSIYFYFKYLDAKKTKYIILIGIFAAFAILTKWAVGLLVFSAWGINIIFNRDLRRDIKSYFHIILSFLISCILVLPWQIYAYLRFPKDYIFENQTTGNHFFNVIEMHSGSWDYYLDILNNTVAHNFAKIIIIALIIFAFPIIKTLRKQKIAVLAYILIMYIFFSFSATKMPMFVNPVLPLLMIVLAAVIISLISKLYEIPLLKNKNKIFKTITIIVLSIATTLWIYDDHEYKLKPIYRQSIWRHYASEAKIFEKLASKIDDSKNAMVFNFPEYGNIRFTFITSIDARSYLPDSLTIANLTKRNIVPYIFDNQMLPEYILKNTNIKIVKSSIWNYDNFLTNIQIK